MIDNIEAKLLADLEQDEARKKAQGETEAVKKDKGFYEALGMCRYTLILGKEHKEKLLKVAKEFRITQGSVVETFLDNYNPAEFAPHFKSKASKGGGRPTQAATQRDLITMLKGMTPEQLAAAAAALSAVKAPDDK